MSLTTLASQGSAVGLDGSAPSKKIKPMLNTPPTGTRVNVVADKIAYDARAKVATATGRVEIAYGDYVLIASRVVYNQAHDRLAANGSVQLKEPGGNVLEADRAELSDRFREGFAEHLRLLLTNDATITAEYARRTEGSVTVYEHVTYTACTACVSAGGTPAWQLRSRQVTHDERDHTIYHKDATLEIAGVPVFYLPYLSHPDPTVNKRSGFLSPSVRYGNTYGLGVEIPYFWDLAPNYDVTFKPVLTTKQGPLMQADFRHRLTNGQYSVSGSGLYQLDANEPPPGDTRWRGAVRAQGEFEINPRWTWGFDGTLVSDRTFLSEYDIDERDEAVSQLYLTGIHDRNYFDARALHFQTLLTDEDQDVLPDALPYIRHSYTFDQPVLGGEAGIDTRSYSLTRADADIPYPGVRHGEQQSRSSTDVHWQRQVVTGGGQIVTPFTRLRSDLYLTENLPDPGAPDGVQETETTARFLPLAGVDARWPFIAQAFGGQHVLTPVAQVIAAAEETAEDDIGNEDAITVGFDHSSLFLEDRFTGWDRWEGGTRANVGVLYTALAANGGFLRVSGGESYHIAGDNSFADGSGLDGTASDLVGALAYQPNDTLRFTYQARVEEDLSDVNVQEVGASLTLDRISGSLNYASVDAEPAYGRPDSERQVWGYGSYNFHGGWSVFGGFRYDLQSDEFLRTTVGFGYECDCMSFKIAFMEDNVGDQQSEKSQSLALFLELKTLGSAGVNQGAFNPSQ